MAKADSNIRLPDCCRDAILRRVFERAERDGLLPAPVAADRPRILTGGAIAREPVEA
jgi:hypothetical protein